MDDVKIIEEVLEGATDDFEYLIIKYQNQVLASVLNIVKDMDVAIDIVQDVFLIAFKMLNTLKNKKLFYPWIKKIAINKALLYLRKSKRDVNIGDDLMNYEHMDSAEDNSIWYKTSKSPETILLNEEVKKYLRKFVDSLPERLRLVLILREIEGLSYDEIAENLNIPVGTVRSRLHYAREYLKARLENQGFADGLQAIS